MFIASLWLNEGFAIYIKIVHSFSAATVNISSRLMQDGDTDVISMMVMEGVGS